MAGDEACEHGAAKPCASLMGEPKAAKLITAASSRSNRWLLFRTVYDANYHLVLGYVLRRTATREDAEDVVAETFLTAWRRLEQLPLGRGARPWLYGVARKALANHRRGERRRKRLMGALHAESVFSSSQLVDPGGEVAAAFARLTDEDRELLALAAWEGLGPGQIAAVLGCSRNAARIRLHRARRRLAHELQGRGEAGGPSPAGGANGQSLVSVKTESGR